MLKLTKKQVILSRICAFLLVVTSIVFIYRFNDDFQELVDDTFYANYYTFFVDPSMAGVANIQRNVAYCNTTSNFQKLDVYTPKHDDVARPVVVYIHGGGWSTGDKSNPFVVDYGAEIVKSDLAFISINYRLAPRSVYPAQNQDVNCALTYIKLHAQQLHIDASRVALIGDSAGGQLAAMAALTSPDKALVHAVVEFYGPSDIWGQITRTPQADQWAINYVGSATNEALAREASPLYAQLGGAPAFLLLHGVNDKTVHYDESVKFAEKLRAAHVDVTLVPVQRADHYFSNASIPSINQIETQAVQFLKQRLLQ